MGADDAPAVIEYYEDGSVKRETWYRNSKVHHDDAPAVIEYHEDGSVKSEGCFPDGVGVDPAES